METGASKDDTCLDCSAYLPASGNEYTEFGICLNDDAFESFVDELLKGPIPDSCRALVEEKKFQGDCHPPCRDFYRVESFEIEDDSPLGRRLHSLMERGELTADALEAALFEERVNRTDWKSQPVDHHARELESGRAEERDKAIDSLGAYIALENPKALEALLQFLAGLPVPITIAEVHLKMRILSQLSHTKKKGIVAPYLIKELGRTPSNNTTRQWILEILRFLELCPSDVVKEPLERMLAANRFSQRLRSRVLDVIARSRY
jgi:hypothetical protein